MKRFSVAVVLAFPVFASTGDLSHAEREVKTPESQTQINIKMTAGCHFNTGNAIVCTTARNAALAFKNFGVDIKRTDLDYNRQLLQQAGCARAYNPNYKDAIIKQMQLGKIATPSGWVMVMSAAINDKDLVYFAQSYVTGKCEKYIPKAYSIPADSYWAR